MERDDERMAEKTAEDEVHPPQEPRKTEREAALSSLVSSSAPPMGSGASRVKERGME